MDNKQPDQIPTHMIRNKNFKIKTGSIVKFSKRKKAVSRDEIHDHRLLDVATMRVYTGSNYTPKYLVELSRQ